MRLLYIFVLIVIANAGAEQINFSGRIANGLPAVVGDAFALRILSVRDVDAIQAHVSTGVAISATFGLCSAQAIYDFDLFYVGYGSINVDEQEIQTIPRNNIRIYGDYDPATLDHNIAVLKFTTNVDRYLPLATSPATFQVLMTFGHGYYNVAEGTLNNTLQTLIVLRHPSCDASNVNPRPDSYYFECGIFPSDSYYANGDQGGPVTDVGKTEVRGLISAWTLNDELVFVNILSYREFIVDSMTDLSQ